MSQPRATYGITRIDQPEKKNHGYYVRITHRGQTNQKYFPDKSLGGKSKSLSAARAYRDKLLAKLPKYKQEQASRKRRNVLKSGVTGVTHVVSRSGDNKTYEYWQAAWVDGEGKRRTAKFSISRYGSDDALGRAIKARRKALRGQKKSATPKTKAARKTTRKKK